MAVARKKKKRLARVWIFLIRKGGSTKTTSSVNFAAALAYRFKRKVLLVDLDPQGNATSYVGLADRLQGGTVNTLFTRIGVDPHSVIYPVSFLVQRQNCELHVMPATRDLDETDLSMKATQAGMFKPVIDALAEDYDDIVFDTRPTRSLLTLSAMICAQYPVVPMEAGVFALDALKDTMLDIQEVGTGLNPALQPPVILPARVREATNLSREVLGSAAEQYDQYLIRYDDTDEEGNQETKVLYIRDSTLMGEAPGFGKPGIAYRFSENVAAQDYVKLAEVLHVRST